MLVHTSIVPATQQTEAEKITSLGPAWAIWQDPVSKDKKAGKCNSGRSPLGLKGSQRAVICMPSLLSSLNHQWYKHDCLAGWLFISKKTSMSDWYYQRHKLLDGTVMYIITKAQTGRNTLKTESSLL